jgi:hypothetical protein
MVAFQSLRRLQDPANGDLVTCFQQLWDLRRVAFSFVFLPDGGESLVQFIKDLQEFVQEHSLRLESIHTRVRSLGNRWSREYTRQGNTRNDLVSWELEYGVYGTPPFVDKW